MRDDLTIYTPPIPGAPSGRLEPLERLLEAMILTSTINRQAGDAFRVAFRVAVISAPYGIQGRATEQILQAMLSRLDSHLATLPQDPRPQ